ncbi:dihydrodipicolinate synthase family protein [Echinicola strongylocentroti]|uniref:Dihydrodipicolinate synthase family protein n=1 Tax=Echinicola strongylocentroti TaxID=1795355 RepID=A0A2Z4IJJ6_9BACT|nr:dihydrodipicolinate synthase family protein [Echinicola strongylocentroti]AWW30573.1 dihydrodipicolinate synthase family protein [Echinicola strongylocentroti]
MKKQYQGVVVPMVTPLTASREIDREAVAKMMEEFAKNDISPLVLGTTGESASFSEKESLEMIKATVASKAPHQQVYAGVVSNLVEEQHRRGSQYLEQGVDAIVATLPAYYVLSDDQMKLHFEGLADHLKGPLLMYNIKATTQMSIPLSVVEEMSHHPHIWGLKDSERDISRMHAAIDHYQKRADFSFFCGWGAQSANSLRTGADGIVPSTGNIVPEMYKSLYTAAKEGDEEGAVHYQELTDEVAKIYQGGRSLGASLAALKVLLQQKGWCQAYLKPPLTELSKSEEEKVLSDWQTMMEQVK